jgi:tRNA(adenine34) deaminase
MRLAVREAQRASEHQDVPIGAVVVRDGEPVAAAHNERELRQDRPPTPRSSRCAERRSSRAAGGCSTLSST